MTKENILKETKDFKVIVGQSAHHSDTPNLLLYQIVNKKYGVTEMETSVYARSLQAIDGIQDELDAVRNPTPLVSSTLMEDMNGVLAN